MKNLLHISALALTCLLFSCSKETSLEEETGGNNTIGNGGGGTGSGSNGGTGLGNDYQPTTAGSEWRMASTTAGSYTITALAGDTLIEGKKFYRFDNNMTGRGYISKENGVYTHHTEHPIDEDLRISMVMLKDAAVGTTWTNAVGYMGATNDFIYTVIGRDATKSVNGKEYKDVITVQYEATMQNPLTGGNMKFATGRIYTAKGIGTIATKYEMDLFGQKMEDSTYLVSYIIK
jgi:hypothetical protein